MAPQVAELVAREAEHEVGWKPCGVAFDSPYKGFCLDVTKRSKVSVEHDSVATHDDDPCAMVSPRKPRAMEVRPPVAAWADEGGRTVAAAEIGDSARVLVNPCYHRALGIRDEPARKHRRS